MNKSVDMDYDLLFSVDFIYIKFISLHLCSHGLFLLDGLLVKVVTVVY